MGESPVIVSGITEPGPLTLDDNAVYWIDITDGVRVMALAK